ncbi:MAG: hypothetical protein ACYDD7_20950 [Acidimicrobiales bacterium]
MKMKARVIGGAALVALVLAGCAHGPTIAPITIGLSDPLCKDSVTFQAQAAALEAASTQGDLASVHAAVTTVHTALRTLEADAAKLPDKVNGHLVKDDLGIAKATYAALDSALAAANPADSNALRNALASVQDKEGQVFTAATGRLDAYTKKVCNLVVTTPTSTVAPTAPTTTSGGVVGPVPATTPSSSTVAPTGTTVAPAASTVAPPTTA